jgi:tRNA dimethylallyltransferase
MSASPADAPASPTGRHSEWRPPLVIVAGPTATGKTDLAITIALAIRAAGRPADIISADSRQIYRGMDVGTAKPTMSERRGVPHHGIDLAEPDQAFSVADFVEHATGVLAALAEAQGVGILAGGTGFWIAAVTEGLPVEQLPWDPDVRAMLEADLARDGLPSLVTRLRGLAPARAGRTDLHNPRRVVRALEIATLAGDAPLPTPAGYPGPILRINTDVPDHAQHRAWIARRAETQLDGGILPEAETLRTRFDPGLPAFSAIGYREAWDLLDGRLDRGGYLAVNVRRNVAFARRQRTWFRRERADLAIDATEVDARRRAIDATVHFAGG